MLTYFLALLAGLSLGLLGGGGSILTVPILVYIAKIPAKEAVAMSLAIVGTTTLFGVYNHYKHKNIQFKVALLFGGAAIPGTYLGSYISQFISGTAQLLIFAVIMIIAASFMFKGRTECASSTKSKNIPMTLISGAFVGVMTGLIGVGGRFSYRSGTNVLY